MQTITRDKLKAAIEAGIEADRINQHGFGSKLSKHDQGALRRFAETAKTVGWEGKSIGGDSKYCCPLYQTHGRLVSTAFVLGYDKKMSSYFYTDEAPRVEVVGA